MINLKSALSDLFFFAFIFCLIFSGDYSINGFFIFYFFSFAFIALTRIKSNYLAPSFFIGILFMFLSMITSPLKDLEPGYYNSFIFIFFSFLYLYIYLDLFSYPSKTIGYSVTVLLIIFFVFILLNPSQSNRTSFIFGPTILYRVILFFYAVSMLFLLRENKNLFFLFIAAITFFSILKIGSRGGTIVFFIMTILSLAFYFDFRRMVPYIFISFLFIIYLVDFSFIFNSRAFYFSSDSESSNIRIEKINMLNEFFQYDIWQVLFGLNKPGDLVGNYPHNILVEVLMYHGLIAFVLIFLFFLSTFLVGVFTKNIRIKSIFITSLPILIGSQFSGRLLDNYFFIPLVFVIPFMYYFDAKSK